MKLKITFLALLLTFAFQANAQQTDGVPPIETGVSTSMRVAPSISSRTTIIPAITRNAEMQDGRASKFNIVPGKGTDQNVNDVLSDNPHRLKGAIQSRMPSLVFETAQSNSQPTDPSGAVGPNHYFAVFNTGFRIFDKAGAPLTAQLNPSMLGFSGGFCCDLTVSYDNAADRWVVSILWSSDGHVEVAVSNTADPLTTTWNVYSFPNVSDYNKVSVWSDGYYMTQNGGNSNSVWVMERDEMLAGNAAAQFVVLPVPGFSGATGNFSSPQVLNVTDSNLPATGSATLVWHQDDAWAGVAADQLNLWEIDVDWATIGNSTISAAPTSIALTPFVSVFDNGSFINLAQPNGGTNVDAVQGTIMNQSQFRKFAAHNSALVNFTVDTDGGAGELAGIRWMELRQTGDGQPWTLFQEGTYTAPDGRHAWMASMAMDVQGNIGMGYSSMSGPTTPATTFIGSYYTGRMANDALGTMTVAEELILAGDSNIPSTRYADYSKIDVDPSNNKAFWFVTEMMQSGKKNVAGVFQLAPNTTNDVGVISVDTPVSGALTNAETVTVTVFNYGESTASGFDVTYQVDGGATVTEAFVGTLATQTSAQYTFTTTADLSIEGQTYTINSCTVLAGDEDTGNDCTSADVIHVSANDIGVTAITSPTSGEGLGNETITVTIENFGTASQSNFDVTYTVDAGTPVTESVAGPLAGGATISYSFTATADISAPATYSIVATTALAGDADTANDATTISVTNVSCQSTLSTDTPIVISEVGTPTITSVIAVTDDFVINDVNVTINITHTWANDLDIFLIAPDGTTRVELTTDNGATAAQNYTNTTFDDEATVDITAGTAPFTGTFRPEGMLSDFDGFQSAGNWTLEVNDDFNADGGTLDNWTLQLCTDANLSVDENQLDGDLQVIHQGNSQFLINFPTTSVTDRLTITVTDMLGKRLLYQTVDNEGGQGYQYALDMSYVASGIYMVRIGNNQAGNIKRIIVE